MNEAIEALEDAWQGLRGHRLVYGFDPREKELRDELRVARDRVHRLLPTGLGRYVTHMLRRT
ncbi:MAG: hypothetical protein V3T08_09955 [Gemmatimonadota bacterium]